VTGSNAVSADPSAATGGDYPPYYQEAYDEYHGDGGLKDRYKDAVNAVKHYLEVHGEPDEDGIWPLHNDDSEMPCELADADHFAQYDDLAEDAEEALEDCQTSLLVAYDDYDTFAAGALDEKEPVKVLFRICGEQIPPEQASGFSSKLIIEGLHK
jgi:hypothetical protein